MVIEAISSVRNNGLNRVNFEARKDKKSATVSNPTVSSTIKAIPLAALLAMSPMTTTNAGDIMRGEGLATTTEVVQTPKKIKRQVIPDIMTHYSGKQDLIVDYIDKDGNLSNFERVDMMTEHAYGLSNDMDNCFDGQVKVLCNYNFSIMGDDGREHGVWKFTQVGLTPDRSETANPSFFVKKPEVINLVQEIINSNANNNSIKVKNVSRALYPRRDDGGFTIGKNDIKALYHNNAAPLSFGHPVFEGEISTQVGKYKVTGYTNDTNPDNYETLVLERNDGLKFKLDGLRVSEIRPLTQDEYEGEDFALYRIDISWPNIGEYTIYDDELFVALLNTGKQDSNNNNAIKVSKENCHIKIDDLGIPFRVSTEELLDL